MLSMYHPPIIKQYLNLFIVEKLYIDIPYTKLLYHMCLFSFNVITVVTIITTVKNNAEKSNDYRITNIITYLYKS